VNKAKHEKCEKKVGKDNINRCSSHKKCFVDTCDNISRNQGYCSKHYNQIICREQKKNCDSPRFLCDETFGDFSDISEIEIGEGFFDKPICDLSESDINGDLPFQDELFEGLDSEKKEGDIKNPIRLDDKRVTRSDRKRKIIENIEKLAKEDDSEKKLVEAIVVPGPDNTANVRVTIKGLNREDLKEILKSSDEIDKVLGKRKRDDENSKKDGRKNVRKSRRKSIKKSRRKSTKRRSRK